MRKLKLIEAETRRLIAMGVVLERLGLDMLDGKRGRPKQYESSAEKKAAYRKRRKERALAGVYAENLLKQQNGRSEKVTDLKNGKLARLTSG